MARALVTAEDVNVIIVDWRGGSLPLYRWCQITWITITIISNNTSVSSYLTPAVQSGRRQHQARGARGGRVGRGRRSINKTLQSPLLSVTLPFGYMV